MLSRAVNYLWELSTAPSFHSHDNIVTKEKTSFHFVSFILSSVFYLIFLFSLSQFCHDFLTSPSSIPSASSFSSKKLVDGVKWRNGSSSRISDRYERFDTQKLRFATVTFHFLCRPAKKLDYEIATKESRDDISLLYARTTP